MVVKLSLRFLRGLLVAGSHRIADPKWQPPPQSGSSRTGFPAGICWHLSLPGDDYWQLHILSFFFFFPNISKDRTTKIVADSCYTSPAAGGYQAKSRLPRPECLYGISDLVQVIPNLISYAQVVMSAAYITQINYIMTLHEMLSNAVFTFFSQFLNSDLSHWGGWKLIFVWRYGEAVKPQTKMGLLNSLHVMCFCISASCCIILCKKTGNDATTFCCTTRRSFFVCFTIWLALQLWSEFYIYSTWAEFLSELVEYSGPLFITGVAL